MSSLILDSFEIHNFRPFRHLKIKRLARVNLIVGENNVGKTSLLEALHLYASRAVPEVIWNLLETHQESLFLPRRGDFNPLQQRLQSLAYLFYGRPKISSYPKDELPKPITIGPVGSPKQTLKLAMAWYKEIYDLNLKAFLLEALPPEQIHLIQEPVPALVAQLGDEPETVYRLDKENKLKKKLASPDFTNILVPTQSLSEPEIDLLWNKIALTSLEDNVIKALRIIGPKIERLTLFNSLNGAQPGRIPMVRVAGDNKPIPLLSLGEGVNRLFNIALALVNAQNGLLLIDELESALYYAIQPDVWRIIFDLAQRLNIQVLVTTHSWECIDAFQIAANENENVEGLLFSLRNKKGKPGEVVAILYEEEELEIAAHAQIEVR